MRVPKDPPPIQKIGVSSGGQAIEQPARDPFADLPFPAHGQMAQATSTKGVSLIGIRRASGDDRFELEVQKLRVRAEHAKTPDLIFEALKSPDYYLRNEAAHALIRWAKERGWVPAIRAFIQSEASAHPPHARAWAEKALARIEPPTAPRVEAGPMSFPFLPVANGAVSAILDVNDGSIRHVRGSIFSNPKEGVSTKDAIERIETPLSDPMIECGYLAGTIGAFRRSAAGTIYLLPELGTKRIDILVQEGDRWSSARIDLAKEPIEVPSFAPDPSASHRLRDYVDRFASWQASFTDPPLADAEAKLYRQMRACLLMGQAEDGQIVASIPPGHWNISWVRDMSYALVAMAESGAHDQARRGLEFLFARDHDTKYESFPFMGIESGVGAPYQISVVRHFGDGKEEADVEDGSPNIEFDGFGLALWAMERYVAASGDLDFARTHWDVITKKVGDAILSVVDPDNGLIKRDSSIWERHLPGRRFTYTSAACERGLRSLAELAERIGDRASAERYASAANDLREAIRTRLIGEDGAILGYDGEPLAERTYDASTIEVINWGLLDLSRAEDFDVALATIRAFREHLSVPDSPGFKRTTDPGWYEEQEWVVLDLRVATALHLMAQSPEAERRGMRDQLRREANELIDWVVKHVNGNGGVVPELLENGTRKFEGAIPMVGYGPGALMLALREKARSEQGRREG